MTLLTRREASKTIIAAALAVSAPSFGRAQTAPFKVRLGYQKSSTLIGILKTQGTLDKALAPLGATISWAEFSSGLPLLEALNAGAIDVSADVADTVPLFAQAAGAKFAYYARETPSPTAQAIIVPLDSSIKSIGDLRGKKVAVTKAAGSHFLLLAALRKAGLAAKDIEPAYLAPADGRAAFERRAVDAWVTWDPFVAAIETTGTVRRLADADGVANYQRYYLAAASFAKERREVLDVVFKNLKAAGQWAKDKPDDAAKLLAPVWGLPEPVVAKANSRRSYDIRGVTADALSEQQTIADVFFTEGLLPKPVKASEAEIWAAS